jgi:hypothetical protein
VLEGLEWVKQCISVVVRVWNGCGNHYLSKGINIESEMADTEGSTATALEPLLEPFPKMASALKVFQASKGST